jgi:hypothetical protein
LKKQVLQKENDIISLEKHLDAKDKRLEERDNEIAKLKEQIALQAQGDKLKEEVTRVNTQLAKQTALAKHQAF